MTKQNAPDATEATAEPVAPVRTRRKRDSLNREVILEAAEKIAVRDGVESLTFQALGAELSAHPTSMYRHFRDKDELMLALIDSLRDRSYLGALVPTGDWRDDLRLAARVVHEHYLRYPLFAQLMAARTTRRPREFANMEYIMRALLEAGFEPEEALRYQRVFGNYVRALSSIESAAHALPEEVQREDDLAWRLRYEQLDPEEFPAITSAGGPPLRIGDAGTFDLGLELLLEGLEARAEAARAQRATG
ncbi:TetR/AcrR family transcriptional regulator [Leucobacter celer]|uniref:TetR/AcrR family transcriptional regulator n=1 Tax=Leucobacter celer TaxID=668625 RepID=UPI0006A7EB63|nr:TetR/AcrR family transcriptional regulator C-terminal domain-containing protein [Leucobacter celer]